MAAESSTVCSSTRKRFARAGDLALRRAGLVGGLLAVEKRLRDGGADAARRVGAVDFGARRCVVGRAARGDVSCRCIGNRRCAVSGDLRTIARQRLRHVFVGGANLGALRVELRIVLIGAHQRSLDRVGQSGRRAHIRHQQDRSRSSGNQLHPTHPW